MTTALNRYATQGNQFVAQLATELDTPENNTHALRILRAVFHTIRKHLTPAASMHLIAHLPMAVKSIYVDGWNIDAPRVQVFDYEEFIDEVYKSSNSTQYKPFCRKPEVEASVQAVFRTLKRHLSDGEYSEMMSYMPVSLRLYMNSDYILEGQSYFL
jgi:uncharacterized protein (DUF2267 family)